MAQLTCELCGSTEFVKDGGYFVCQGCGTKYTVEEARAMLTGAAAPAPAPQPTYVQPTPVQPIIITMPGTTQPAEPQPTYYQPQPVASPIIINVPGAAPAAEPKPAEPKPLIEEFEPSPSGSFDPAKVSIAMGSRAINNYICQGFQQLIAEYEKLPHPTENALRPVTEKAKACLAALNNAAMIDPDDHVADILIFENCEEIVDAMRHAKVHEKREDGSYRTSTPLFTNSRELSVPGEKDSWSTKARYHRQFLIEEYKAAHPLDGEQIAELQEEKAQLEAELAVLKEEKKSKGFFNFSEKGEVKERMRPYEAKLSEVNSRIYAIEHGADTYIEDCLKSLSASFTRLHF